MKKIIAFFFLTAFIASAHEDHDSILQANKKCLSAHQANGIPIVCSELPELPSLEKEKI
jgi:hypothetical protein